ncbi:hypothetical protein [Nonlabens arenilitoris]|uniref:hypothetical protein n=1 Tax=Nonlabens arenilitoris TaxID=1217969 RepID=UPI001475FFCC|nr:hypothetical protein [Nonlabens arenilitoris]
MQKSYYDSVNNIYIDENHINYLSSGQYESYTFSVYDPIDTTRVSNLLFHKRYDGSFTPILFKYDKSDAINPDNLSIEYEVISTNFQKSASIAGLLEPCGMTSDCACWRIGETYDDGTFQIIIETTTDDCTISFIDDGSDGGSGGGGGSGSGSGSGTGGSGSGSGSGTGGSGSGSGSGSSGSGSGNGAGSSGSGNGSSSGGSTGNNNPDDPNEKTPCLSLSNGDCAGAVSVTIPSPTQDSKAEELKAITDDAVVNSELIRVQSLIDSDSSGNYSEDGAKIVKRDGQPTTSRQPSEKLGNEVYYDDPAPENENISIHIHQTKAKVVDRYGDEIIVETIPAPSNFDVLKFLQNCDEAQDNANDDLEFEDIIHIVPTIIGTYAIVVNDSLMDNSTTPPQTEAESALDELIAPNNPDAFYDFIDEYKIKIVKNSDQKTDQRLRDDFINFINNYKLPSGRSLGLTIYLADRNTDGSINEWIKQ